MRILVLPLFQGGINIPPPIAPVPSHFLTLFDRRQPLTECRVWFIFLHSSTIVSVAERYAIPIHASDTLSAALAGIQGQLPSQASIMLVAISGINTALAIFAQPPTPKG